MLTPRDNLFARIATGDPDATRSCVDQYGRLVWSLARRYSPTVADAEDAVQDIMMDLIRSAARFDPSHGTESGFVAMLARRRLIDLARRRATRRKEDASKSSSLTSNDSDSPAPAAVVALPTDLEQRLDASRAARAIGALAPEERDVLLLSTVEGLTYAEIAEQKGIPLGTVKTYARRGLLSVRARLSREEVEA